MAKCSGITRAGGACKGIPIDGSPWCYVHHPDHAEERRRHGSKGGKRGGRGRPQAELARLQSRFEELADSVLAGTIERGVGAVAGQLLNGARACMRDVMAAREQEELVARLEVLEENMTPHTRQNGAQRWRQRS
ncbi:MAG: hypothetical protein M3522_01475 [Actinomycetota bacterium]|jgi:hypothetical protein|nr:hypothetical protein [Actinomycetota bacterium]